MVRGPKSQVFYDINIFPIFPFYTCSHHSNGCPWRVQLVMGYLFSLVNAAVFAISLYSRDSTQRFLMILVLNDALRTSIFRQNLGHHFIATFQLLSFQRRPNLSMSGVKKTKQMFLFRTSLFAAFWQQQNTRATLFLRADDGISKSNF